VVELEKAGYVQRRRVRDDKGCLRGTEYVIYEQPQQPDEDASESPASAVAAPFFSSQPTMEGPVEAAPVLENSTLENTTQLNIDNTNSLKNKILTSQNTDSFPFPSSLSATAAVRSSETKGWKRTKRRSMSKGEMDAYREMIRENVDYDSFIQERPYDAGQLDEMVELMVESVCSNKETLRVAGTDFPQAVVKSRLLKLVGEHIRFVFDCLKENTTKVRNMKQYLLTVLYNAPAIIENHYAARVNYDLYGVGAAA
jgi:hypothetical protein